MAPPRRIWTSTSWMVGGRLWGSLCTAAVLWFSSRSLSGDDFGRLTFYLAIFAVLDALVDLGSGQALVQSVAQRPELARPELRHARRLRLVMGVFGALLVSTLAFVTGEQDAPLIALASLYPITHFLELSTLGLRQALLWRPQVLVRAAASLLGLVLVGLLWWKGEAPAGLFLVAIALGSTLGNLLAHLVGRGHLALPGHTTGPEFRSFLLRALPLGAAAISQQLYFWIDNAFLRAFHGDTLLGQYNLAVRLMSWTLSGAVFASAAALPWLAREHQAGRLARATAQLSLPLVILGALGLGFLRPLSTTLVLFFGEGFRASGPVLEVLFLASLAVHLGAPALTAVTAAGRGRRVLALTLAALLLNLALNALLVPEHGATGAAWATLLTEVFVALGALVSLRGLRGLAALPSLRWLLPLPAWFMGGALSQFLV